MEVLASVLEKFMIQVADENRRQSEDVSRRFEEACVSVQCELRPD